MREIIDVPGQDVNFNIDRGARLDAFKAGRFEGVRDQVDRERLAGDGYNSKADAVDSD